MRCSITPLFFIGFILHLSLGAWSDFNTLSKMMINGIDAMVAPGRTIDRNESSIPSCRKYTPRASDASVIRGVSAVTYRKAWPLLPSSVRGCSRQPVGYDQQTTATILPIDDHKSLDIYMIQAQMMVESHGDWSAVSSEKCIGSMQISPVLAKEFGMPTYYLDHPIMGLDYGIRIMEYLWSRLHFVTNWNERWKLSLSAYNCGYSRTIKSYLTLGRRWQQGIPGETRSYIRKVQNKYYGRGK